MKRLLALLVFSLALLLLPRLYERSDWSPEQRRTDYVVEGIDASRYQGKIDWQTVRAGDFDFAFIKATEGESLVDSTFRANWSSAAEAGLRRGAYHFFRPEVEVQDQIRLFIETVDLQPGDLPPVLDVEVRGAVGEAEWIAAISDWLHTVQAHYGIRPIIYTGQKFYNRYLAGRFDAYPLWLARYDARQPVPACGRDWQFWQYTNQGRIEGIDGPVDLNVFWGSPLDLANLSLPNPTLPAEPVGPPVATDAAATAKYLNRK